MILAELTPVLVMSAATLAFSVGSWAVGRDVVAEWGLSQQEIRQRSAPGTWSSPLTRRARIASPAGLALGLTCTLTSALVLAHEIGLLEARLPVLLAAIAVLVAFVVGLSAAIVGRPRLAILPAFRAPGAFSAAVQR